MGSTFFPLTEFESRGTGSLLNADQPLGEKMMVEIDPQLAAHRLRLWVHPHGFKLKPVYVSFFEEGLTETVAPNYADTDVVGRAELYKHWISTSAREIQITFKFQVQAGELDNPDALIDEVVRPARWLDMLKYSAYDKRSKLTFPPPPVLLRIGNLFHGRCVLTAADLQWQSPWDTKLMLPYGAHVACTFAVQRRSTPNLGYTEIAVDRGEWQ